jgi:hypothetical protein
MLGGGDVDSVNGQMEYKTDVRSRWIVLSGLVVSTASCGWLPRPTATSQSGVELVPGPGYFHVTAEPPLADAVIEIRSIGSDGEASGVVDSFQPGDVIEVDRAALAGQRGLSVDGFACDGRFQVVEEMVTEVLLSLRDDGCRLTTVRIHEVEVPQVEPSS